MILEYGIRLGLIDTNPFNEMTKNKVNKVRRLVTPDELRLAVEMGRKIGGPQHIVAMALMTAYLCVRRSVEVRGLTRESIQPKGILWKNGKDKTGAKPAILILWIPEFQDAINETLQIKRNHVAGSMYLFGNMRGQRYTKGGWKASLDRLMWACVTEAAKREMPFKRFSLQDCRPMGVTDKLTRGDKDTKDATGHTSDAMIEQVYDRRIMKVAKGAKISEKKP